MKKLIILAMAIMLLTGCASVNKHLWGYEKAIYVENDLPDVLLYWPIAGIEDKIWWEMSTVQDRSQALAEIINYTESDIACDHTGNWLYLGAKP